MFKILEHINAHQLNFFNLKNKINILLFILEVFCVFLYTYFNLEYMKFLKFFLFKYAFFLSKIE